MSNGKTKGPGRPERILTTAEKAAILEGYREGESTLQMARALRCCQKKVSQFLKSQGVQYGNRLSEAEIQAAIEEYREGASLQDVAKLLQVSKKTARRYLAMHVKIRAQGTSKISKILHLSEKGLRVREIAKAMNLSEEGVRYHLRRWASLKS